MFLKFIFSSLCAFLCFSCGNSKSHNNTPFIIKDSFVVNNVDLLDDSSNRETNTLVDTKSAAVEDNETVLEDDSTSESSDYFYEKNPNVISHKYYELLYSEEHEQPFWVKYVGTKEHVLDKKYKRKNNFREDPLVETQSATLSDYVKSGYDRGHLCPAGDMCFSETAMSESFYMSNMSPQSPSFNRGKWKSLEEKVRKWSVKYDTAIIYCGGVLSDIAKTIGSNKVSVPKYYYKVVYCPTINSAVGFIMPNEKCELSLSSYMVSVDSVESLTKIDFYNNYLPNVQKSFESNSTLSFWF